MPLSFIASIAAPVAINWLSNKLTGGNKQQQQQQQPVHNPVPTISYNDALSQAQGVVNPLYDQQLEQTMQGMDFQNMQRGFYGQMPGDALKNARAVDVERGRASQTANLAQQLYQQSQANAFTQQQLGQNQQQIANQQRQNAWGNVMNLGNMAIQGALGYHGATGQFPWQANPLGNFFSDPALKNLNTNQSIQLLASGNWGTPAAPSSVPQWTVGNSLTL